MGEEIKKPLLVSHLNDIKSDGTHSTISHYYNYEEESVGRRFWVESKKLWRIVGPAILARLSSYTINMVTLAFAGHMGTTELAAMSIICNVITGFDFGLLLGMASALETLCGQAYGAKQYHMLGIYMQRSWIVLLVTCVVLLPLYILTSPLLKLLGQPDDVAELAGYLALCVIPVHFSFAIVFPLQRFLQCQLKNSVNACSAFVAAVVHVAVSYLFVYGFKLGVVGAAIALNISWWTFILGMFLYTVCGGCPDSWKGFSMEAFTDLWDFVKISASSGVMLCLESWYYRILILMTGNMKDVEIAVDALSVCMAINGWEMSIPLSFFAGTGVRVANELGAGNAKGAKFATVVSVVTSTTLGVIIMILVMVFHQQIGFFFSSSKAVLDVVDTMTLLLGLTILLNSVQPVLSGVAVGSGWQASVAYVNIGCYYMVGLPLGLLLELVFHKGVMGVWTGMIFGGTALQTVILVIMTTKCDWEKEVEKAGKHLKKWGHEDA